MKKVLTSTRKIRFQDCDPFNHLNNSRYIDYFLNAREDQLIEHYNLDVYEEAKQYGKSWVVRSNQISYINPAHNMEEVCIESQLIKFSNKQLTVELVMWNKDQTHIKAFAWVSFVHFNITTQKAETHDERFMGLFKKVINPVEQTSFEERGRFLTIKYARAS